MKKLLIIFCLLIAIGLKGQTVNLNNNTVSIDGSGNVTANGYVSAGKNTLAYRYYVGTKGNWATIKEAITWLNTNMVAESEIILDANSHYIADSIHVDLPYNLVIRGVSSNTTNLKAATGLLNKPFFSLYSNVTFHGLTMDGSTLANWGDNQPEDMVRVNSGCTYIEFDDVVCYTGRVGLRLLDSADIWVTNSIFEEMSGEGIGIYNASTKQGNFYDIEINSFKNCTKGIEFANGDSILFAVKNNLFFSDAPTDTALYFSAATLKTTNTITTISSNDLSSSDKALIGLDFTDIKNSNVFVYGNKNLPNKNPQGFFDVAGSATLTAIITAGAWTKANWDAYDIATSIKLVSTGINSVGYLPSYKGDLTTEIIFSILSGGTNQNYEAAIIKNPTWNANMEVTGGDIMGIQAFRLVSSGSDQNVTVKVRWSNVVRGDDFSLILRGIGTTTDPTITYLTGIIE